MKTTLVLAASCFILLSSCTDREGAKKVLLDNGYSSIEITGYRFFSGQDDSFVTGFKAISPAGNPVSDVVTKGFLKGKTIRLD